MNDLLGNQVPYFRCSDQDIVNVYYFLWALYLMYYDIDLSDEQDEYYAHAILIKQLPRASPLRFHLPVRCGVMDRRQGIHAPGNVLTWKPLLQYADLDRGTIPGDNLGPTWRSVPISGADPSSLAHGRFTSIR